MIPARTVLVVVGDTKCSVVGALNRALERHLVVISNATEATRIDLADLVESGTPPAFDAREYVRPEPMKPRRQKFDRRLAHEHARRFR